MINIRAAYDLLLEYEQWEADLISQDKMWWPFSKDDVITGEVYNKMLELQEKRNNLLNSLRAELKPFMEETK